MNSVISVLLRQETATWGGLDLGSDGVWDRDYGWGVRVRRHFGARGRSSVRYGTRLGDLKESWFILFFQLNPQHTRALHSRRSRIGIKFIDSMNRTYGVELPKYQSTENPKYQKSKVSNTLMRPYIFVSRLEVYRLDTSHDTP